MAAERVAQLHRQRAAAARELQEVQSLLQAAAERRAGAAGLGQQEAQLQDELGGLHDQMHRFSFVVPKLMRIKLTGMGG